MINEFNRNIELLDGLDTEHMRVLYYDFSKAYTGDYRSYENSRICTILEGNKIIKVDKNDEFSYSSNEFVLLPPNSNVNMEIPVPTKALVLEIDDNIIQKVYDKISLSLDLDLTKNSQKFFLGEKDNNINHVLNNIINAYFSQEKNKIFLMDLYIQEMIYNVLKMQGSNFILRRDDKNPVPSAIKYMKANYSKNIKIKDIANNLNMSESNFSSCFKRTTGISPKDYIKNLKLSKAIELLKENTVTEVAFELGYENISYFISEFKKRYGYTPKQYQIFLYM